MWFNSKISCFLFFFSSGQEHLYTVKMRGMVGKVMNIHNFKDFVLMIFSELNFFVNSNFLIPISSKFHYLV